MTEFHINNKLLEEIKLLAIQLDVDASWEIGDRAGNIQYGLGLQHSAEELRKIIKKVEDHYVEIY